jgi:hypothetical protein
MLALQQADKERPGSVGLRVGFKSAHAAATASTSTADTGGTSSSAFSSPERVDAAIGSHLRACTPHPHVVRARPAGALARRELAGALAPQ